MLRGLLDLEGFNSAVSLHYVEEGKPYLRLPHRMWGEISLGLPYNLVATFSHDSRESNEPFVSLYQWLEELCLPDLNVEAFHAFEVEWSDATKWHEFFKMKLLQKVDKLQEAARASRQQVKGYTARAASIMAALN